jgi:hypothetical protein
VGASGVLHTIMAAGVRGIWRRAAWDRWILLGLLLAAKLASSILGIASRAAGRGRCASVRRVVRICGRGCTLLADRYNPPPDSYRPPFGRGLRKGLSIMSLRSFSRPGFAVHRHDELPGAALAGQIEATFAEASEVLGYDLWKLCQEGPPEALNRPNARSRRCWRRASRPIGCGASAAAPCPQFMAGHSLGEFTALVAAGCLDFKTAVAGEIPRRSDANAVPQGQGAMAAILGLEDSDVEAACAEAAQGEVVEAVNFNAPGQVVIAGTAAAVARAIEAATARGAKRAVRCRSACRRTAR